MSLADVENNDDDDDVSKITPSSSGEDDPFSLALLLFATPLARSEKKARPRGQKKIKRVISWLYSIEAISTTNTFFILVVHQV